MSWVRVDDSFFSHPKVVQAGAEASGLYVWALAYSSHHLTDGHVPAAWVSQVMGKRAARTAEQLVSAGLWEVNGTGWVIHDFLIYNPTRAQVEEKRRKDSARKAHG
jgi:hypothetical protein